MKRYLKLWAKVSIVGTQNALQSKLGAAIFTGGKIIRFALFMGFILVLQSKITSISGYSIQQLIIFFLTFNLIDTITQLFLRETYRFQENVRSGQFDYFLLWPISPLYRSIAIGADPLDIPMLIIIIGALIHFLSFLPITFFGVILYIILILNALVIAVSFHIFVISLAILASEADNILWLYRDITMLGRMPIDIYKEPLRGFLTIGVPVGIMMTFPPKALLGLLSIQGVLVAFVVGGVMLYLSIKSWDFAIKKYTSASS